MIESRVGKPGIRWTALSSYAAGVTGIVGNLFLIAFFTLPDNLPVRAASFGPANDLVGSLGAAFMIPVAVTLSAWLPERLLYRIIQVLGLSAMAILVVGGPLLMGVNVTREQGWTAVRVGAGSSLASGSWGAGTWSFYRLGVRFPAPEGREFTIRVRPG